MDIIHTDINRIKGRHSRPCFRRGKLVPAKAGSGNPEKHWIPGQARNDKLHNTYMAIYRSQSGAALVIALIMMIVLTLIGLASIFTSTFEIKISGNKKGSTNAFYGADSGVQVLVSRVENFNPTLYSAPTYQYNPFSTDVNNININYTNAQATMTYQVTQQGAPRGYGFSALNFEFEHFLVASTGKDQTDSNLIKSTSTIQEKVVRLVPTLQGGY
jgi:hypothetical protein